MAEAHTGSPNGISCLWIGSALMPSCPKCGSSLERIHRRLVDRAISLIYPLGRFRCPDRECGWEGNRGEKQKARKHLLQLLGWPIFFLLVYILISKIVARRHHLSSSEV